MFWSSGKGRNPIHTGRYLNRCMWKMVSFIVITTELPPYAKNAEICVMKLVASDGIVG
jgi:hypothetical protein